MNMQLMGCGSTLATQAFSMMTYNPSKLGEWQFLSCDQLSIGLCMQDYKSLHVEAMICATLDAWLTLRQTAFEPVSSAIQANVGIEIIFRTNYW